MKATTKKIAIFKLNASAVFFTSGLIYFVLIIFFELNARNQLLAMLSGCLGCLIIAAAYLAYLREGAFSPLIVFSVMYFGYAVGGIYYSQAGEHFGKFLAYVDLERAQNVLLMQYGLFYAIICYVMLCFGYFIFSPASNRRFVVGSSGFMNFFLKYYRFLVVPLLIIGLLYWYWVSVVAAGGLLNLIIYFQAFRHLIADTSITTLPYHFYYAGIFLWLLGLIGNYGKTGFIFWVFSFLGMIMILTQGRIALAITFFLSQIVFIALYDSSKEKKAVKAVLVILVLAFVAYFLRIFSNYLFIGKSFSLSDFDFFNVVIGGGNVADLQQLPIVFYTFGSDSLLLGASYLDWLRNSIGQLFGLAPSSIGLIIKDSYVPESSGAPTPGAIGEAYANFSVAAPFFMFGIGLSFCFSRKLAIRSRSLPWLLVYSIFLSRFVFLYPKVDSTMLINFLWGVTPFGLVISLLYLFYLAAKYRKETCFIKKEGIDEDSTLNFGPPAR